MQINNTLMFENSIYSFYKEIKMHFSKTNVASILLQVSIWKNENFVQYYCVRNVYLKGFVEKMNHSLQTIYGLHHYYACLFFSEKNKASKAPLFHLKLNSEFGILILLIHNLRFKNI